MGLFDFMFGRCHELPAQHKGRQYAYLTGNIELAIRVQNGESLLDVCQELRPKWIPGNEHLWDEYNPESLIESDEKRSQFVNCLLYARLKLFRDIRENGSDIQGKDPFDYVAEAPDEVERLQAMFPHLFPAAFEGVFPPVNVQAVALSDVVEELDDVSMSNDKAIAREILIHGVNLQREGKHDEAIEAFTEVIRLEPTIAAGYVLRGTSWGGKHEFDNAIKDYNEALRLDPKDAYAYVNRGVAWQNKDEFDKAIKDYDEAACLDPKDAKLFMLRGSAWESKGEFEKAAKDFAEAKRLMSASGNDDTLG